MGSGISPQPPVRVWTSLPQTPEKRRFQIRLGFNLAAHERLVPTACINGNIDIAVLKFLQWDLFLLKSAPILMVMNYEARCGLWIRHCSDSGVAQGSGMM